MRGEISLSEFCSRLLLWSSAVGILLPGVTPSEIYHPNLRVARAELNCTVQFFNLHCTRFFEFHCSTVPVVSVAQYCAVLRVYFPVFRFPQQYCSSSSQFFELHCYCPVFLPLYCPVLDMSLFSKKGNLKVSHKHYYYTSMFNNVSVDCKVHNCCLDEQRSFYNAQCEKKVKSLPDKYNFILYFSKECCIYITLIKETKRSSDATTSEGLMVRPYSKQELLEGSTNDQYITSDEIDQVFDEKFLSSYSTGKLLDKITSSLVKLKEKQTYTSEEIDVVCTMICSTQETLLEMKLNYEVPYTQWLYNLLMKKLYHHDFVIHERNKGCPLPPVPINEYIHCKSDILIYHETNVECKVALEALHITVETLHLDNHDSPSDLSVDDINLKAGVAELKVDNITSSAENECFFNMFGEAAKLVSSVLCKGKIVHNVIIYGIVVATHKHQYAQLLRLKINFFESTCVFERCRKPAPFQLLINQVITILK